MSLCIVFVGVSVGVYVYVYVCLMVLAESVSVFDYLVSVDVGHVSQKGEGHSVF